MRSSNIYLVFHFPKLNDSFRHYMGSAMLELTATNDQRQHPNVASLFRAEVSVHPSISRCIKWKGKSWAHLSPLSTHTTSIIFG
jgi:hypothetical protein